MSEQKRNYGVIAEYNPFHNGHAYHIAQTRRQGADGVVAVMSGHFVQRGEVAAADKWTRSLCALKNGVDLVLELPLPWAMSTAEHFAQGGISLLENLGCITDISFGSESGDTAALEECARRLSHPAVIEKLKMELARGNSFAAARAIALSSVFPEGHAASRDFPNDILGIEYCKALQTYGSPMVPHAVRRSGAGHDSHQAGEGEIVSASYLRLAGLDRRALETYTPSSCAKLLSEKQRQQEAPSLPERLELPVLSRLRSMSREDFSHLPDISEGLENRLYRAARQASSLEEFYALAKSKRYSHARLRRIAMSAFLGLTQKDGEGVPPYIRVLGFNEKGREILRQAKYTARRPILLRPSQLRGLSPRANRIFSLECRATDLFCLSLPKLLPCGLDCTREIVRVSD